MMDILPGLRCLHQTRGDSESGPAPAAHCLPAAPGSTPTRPDHGGSRPPSQQRPMARPLRSTPTALGRARRSRPRPRRRRHRERHLGQLARPAVRRSSSDQHGGTGALPCVDRSRTDRLPVQHRTAPTRLPGQHSRGHGADSSPGTGRRPCAGPQRSRWRTVHSAPTCRAPKGVGPLDHHPRAE